MKPFLHAQITNAPTMLTSKPVYANKKHLTKRSGHPWPSGKASIAAREYYNFDSGKEPEPENHYKGVQGFAATQKQQAFQRPVAQGMSHSPVLYNQKPLRPPPSMHPPRLKGDVDPGPMPRASQRAHAATNLCRFLPIQAPQSNAAVNVPNIPSPLPLTSERVRHQSYASGSVGQPVSAQMAPIKMSQLGRASPLRKFDKGQATTDMDKFLQEV